MRRVITVFLSATLIFSNLFAKSFLISPISLPKSEIIDLDVYSCNEICLEEYLKNGQIFSFLAKAKNYAGANEKLAEAYQVYTSLFNIRKSKFFGTEMRIALLSSSKVIGRYAVSTTNSVLAYLISKNSKFSLKHFDMEDEEYETIFDAIQKIQSEGYGYVIAPLTKKGALNLSSIETELNIFIPTINKSDISIDKNNIYFGGIDYKEQIDTLLNFSNEKLALFYDENSDLSLNLTEIVEQNTQGSYILKFPVKNHASNLKRVFKRNRDLNNSTVILNTPIVKSSLILSQMTLYDIEPYYVLSTQINYTPLIFTLTQYKDRKKMLIANSIGKSPEFLIETNSLLSNDITYNWINYSSTLGIDYFFSMANKERRLFAEPVSENQIIYNTTIEKPLRSRFIFLEEAVETDF
ncbi:hypothetical protein [Nitrosophilus alvini]|uniref:hypothetical protein n=1 Tax=Nitrosophilus alvini TaxID=2714855 RepID=UPI00190CC3D7|nr:hypothetical protein [Nitrosophilus alvini]